jgi:hypothetical protein
MFITFAIVTLTSCGTASAPEGVSTTDSTKVCCDTTSCDSIGSLKADCLASDSTKK